MINHKTRFRWLQDMEIKNLEPKELIKKLDFAGRHPHPNLINAIWNRRSETEPLLLTLFIESFDDDWADGDDPRWYRFLHAGKFMLAWQNLDALPTFVRLYSADDERLDMCEWFEEDLVYFGPPAIPFLHSVISKASGNKWHYGKGLSGSILTKIATYYPETREEVADIFRAQLPPVDNIPTDVDAMWGDWATELGELADEVSREQILALAEAGVLEGDFFGLQIYRRDMNRGYKPESPPPPIDIRREYRTWYEAEQTRQRRLARERKRQQATRLRPAQTKKKQKIGRNAPCPCGSGKKYKKCHGRPGA